VTIEGEDRVTDRRADPLVVEHYDAERARIRADLLCEIYREAYVGTDREHDPFYSAERFLERFAGYTRGPGFELVIAWAGAEVTGYAFGYALPQGSRWWAGLVDPVPEELTRETGARTFAVIELHVRERWRGRGVASRLHRELVGGRPEERATLLVRQDNPARGVYTHWGWRPVGRLQPYPDSPVYDALILPLHG